jgi:hypothetical protein
MSAGDDHVNFLRAGFDGFSDFGDAFFQGRKTGGKTCRHGGNGMLLPCNAFTAVFHEQVIDADRTDLDVKIADAELVEELLLNGWRAFAQRRRTRSSVSSPESVVRSMQVMARRSQAICQSFFTERRVTRVLARRSMAEVLRRTDSTQSRLREVPRLGWSGWPVRVAMADWPETDWSGVMGEPSRLTISRRGGFSGDFMKTPVARNEKG